MLCYIKYLSNSHIKLDHTVIKNIVYRIKNVIYMFGYIHKGKSHHVMHHMKTHTDENPQECLQCEICLNMKCVLICYIRTHPIHTQQLLYYRIMYNCKYKRLKHINLYTNEKPYMWNYCRKLLGYKIINELQFRNHAREKLYQCSSVILFTFISEIYMWRFVYKDNVMKTNRKFIGEKPYQCKLVIMPFSCTVCDLGDYTQVYYTECELLVTQNSHYIGEYVTKLMFRWS